MSLVGDRENTHSCSHWCLSSGSRPSGMSGSSPPSSPHDPQSSSQPSFSVQRIYYFISAADPDTWITIIPTLIDHPQSRVWLCMFTWNFIWIWWFRPQLGKKEVSNCYYVMKVSKYVKLTGHCGSTLFFIPRQTQSCLHKKYRDFRIYVPKYYFRCKCQVGAKYKVERITNRVLIV